MSGQKYVQSILKTILGCAVFALGFDLFLQPNGLNAGGISGLSMVIISIVKVGTIGVLTGLLNLPLFAIAGVKIGKRFFILSLIGMLLSSVFIDLFMLLPIPETDPLLASVYGGVLCGAGAGIVYTTGGSTGGSDIIVRLLKLRWQDIPIGLIDTCFDLLIAALTGIVFGDVSRALYSGIAIVISGQVIDAVVYRFDYSRVALIISREHNAIVQAIAGKLGRGATYLNGEGCYSGNEIKVVLTAVKRQQLTELKKLVNDVDPEAFVIVQEAHQVLGDGFLRYSNDSL
ncbi:MAG: YitT family protein [Oscillospiraceae bacterium]|nr:YitT family protein [Oscillospiraceae bacterium]